MIYQSRRQGVEVEVTHSVRAYHHGGTLSIESVHHALQGVGTAVEVIAVQLNHEPSHSGVVNSQVPASSYTQVGALGDEMYDPWIMGKFLNGFGGTIRTPIIYHHEVEGEICLLLQHTAYGITYGTHSVSDGYDHSGFHIECSLPQVNVVALVTVQIGIDGTQVTCAGTLHLQLACAVARVHIVKLLLSAQSGVVLHLGIEELIYVHRQLTPAHKKAKVIECRKAIGMQVLLSHILLQDRGTYEPERSHLEIIPHTAQLTINKGHGATQSLRSLHIMVGIEDERLAVIGHPKHAVESLVTQLQTVILGIQEDIWCRGKFCHLT